MAKRTFSVFVHLPGLGEPDEVMEYVAATSDLHLKLTALFGYFSSLRPQEIFALRKGDLIAGSKAEELECCKTMASKGLYSRLAVNVHRQRIKNGKFAPPKSHSKGHVAIFDERAAKAIVFLLKDVKDPLMPLFPHLPDWHMKLWVKNGIPKSTTKDLRRASLYYLGHKTALNDLVSLMKHARHKKPETTMLYLRRPGEVTGEWQELDLDA